MLEMIETMTLNKTSPPETPTGPIGNEIQSILDPDFKSKTVNDAPTDPSELELMDPSKPTTSNQDGQSITGIDLESLEEMIAMIATYESIQEQSVNIVIGYKEEIVVDAITGVTLGTIQIDSNGEEIVVATGPTEATGPWSRTTSLDQIVFVNEVE